MVDVNYVTQGGWNIDRLFSEVIILLAVSLIHVQERQCVCAASAMALQSSWRGNLALQGSRLKLIMVIWWIAPNYRLGHDSRKCAQLKMERMRNPSLSVFFLYSSLLLRYSHTHYSSISFLFIFPELNSFSLYV